MLVDPVKDLESYMGKSTNRYRVLSWAIVSDVIQIFDKSKDEKFEQKPLQSL